MRALPGSIGARLARFGKIAGDIADRRVELADGDAEDIRKGVSVSCHLFSLHLSQPQHVGAKSDAWR
ncbi:hypothetical protein ACCT30_29470 [Rhizobium ruizarguesonis]